MVSGAGEGGSEKIEVGGVDDWGRRGVWRATRIQADYMSSEKAGFVLGAEEGREIAIGWEDHQILELGTAGAEGTIIRGEGKAAEGLLRS